MTDRPSRVWIPYQGPALADIDRNSAQHAVESSEWIADGKAAVVNAIFADRCFVGAGTLLDDRYRTAHGADRLEIAQQDHGIRKIGHVDRRLHVADQSVLGDRHESRRPLAI